VAREIGIWRRVSLGAANREFPQKHTKIMKKRSYFAIIEDSAGSANIAAQSINMNPVFSVHEAVVLL